MTVTDPDRIDTIQSRADLARFVMGFCQEYRENPESWENSNLETFLEALAAWINDMDGYFRNTGQPVPEAPEWKTFAQMLAAASIYE